MILSKNLFLIVVSSTVAVSTVVMFAYNGDTPLSQKNDIFAVQMLNR